MKINTCYEFELWNIFFYNLQNYNSLTYCIVLGQPKSSLGFL